MKKSQSAKENGWESYPADVWNAKAPPPVPRERLLFWTHCADKYGGPILDLCCGNGRYAFPLAERGYEVLGVDINRGLIASARRFGRNMARSGHAVRISFRIDDIVNLDVTRTFRLAIMPMWPFQVLLTQEDQTSCLQRLRRHLAPGGAFAFNLFIPFHRQRGLVEKDGRYEWPPDTNYHSGAPRTYDPATQIETLVESNIHPVKLRHTSFSELKLLFQLTGFEMAELYGDDQDMRPFTGRSDDDYTIVAQRV